MLLSKSFLKIRSSFFFFAFLVCLFVVVCHFHFIYYSVNDFVLFIFIIVLLLLVQNFKLVENLGALNQGVPTKFVSIDKINHKKIDYSIDFNQLLKSMNQLYINEI